MKYLKLFEGRKKRKKLDDLFNDVALFLEEEQPVSKDDGFVECLFAYDHDDLYTDYPLELSFYFKDCTDEESYEKFYKFLKEYGLEIDQERMNNNDFSSKYEIIIKPNKKQIKKLLEDGEMWSNANKYNV